MYLLFQKSAISSGSAGTVAIDLIAFNNKNITKIGLFLHLFIIIILY